METELKIQIASEADLDPLVNLVVAFRDHLEQSTPSDADFRESITLLLKDSGTEFFLGRDGQGTGLGYVQCRYRYSAWISGLDAELEDVFVVREARRNGVGRQLVEFALARASERGCRSIGLSTNERNEAALRLYKRLGFCSVRTLWGSRQLWLDLALS
ncbi:MAG: GNAT family N-acetyltransferase [Okeania sp. SIO3B3]|nr:GNAT family N-acetyltransferase [Okeania sp. SIO3B3]